MKPYSPIIAIASLTLTGNDLFTVNENADVKLAYDPFAGEGNVGQYTTLSPHPVIQLAGAEDNAPDAFFIIRRDGTDYRGELYVNRSAGQQDYLIFSWPAVLSGNKFVFSADPARNGGSTWKPADAAFALAEAPDVLPVTRTLEIDVTAFGPFATAFRTGLE